jgi:hypothetical protein
MHRSGWILSFEACTSKVEGGNPNLDGIPISKHGNKIVHHTPPRKDCNSRWSFRKNLTTIILQLKDVPDLGYGHVYSIESHGGMMVVTYEMIIGLIPNYICFDFVYTLTSLKNR